MPSLPAVGRQRSTPAAGGTRETKHMGRAAAGNVASKKPDASSGPSPSMELPDIHGPRHSSSGAAANLTHQSGGNRKSICSSLEAAAASMNTDALNGGVTSRRTGRTVAALGDMLNPITTTTPTPRTSPSASPQLPSLIDDGADGGSAMPHLHASHAVNNDSFLEDYDSALTGRRSIGGTHHASLKDYEPNSVEYVYERHRRRCRTTTPTASQPTSARRHPRSDSAQQHNLSANVHFSSIVDHLGLLDDDTKASIREKLAPRRIIEDAFDVKFTARLKDVVSRSKPERLAAVQAQRDALLENMFARGSEQIERHEQRLAEIDETRRNQQAAKRLAHMAHVREEWLQILDCIRFATKLMNFVQERKSLETLRRTLVPMLIRKKMILHRRWDRRDITEFRLEDNPEPTPTMIRTMRGQFFEGWSDHELNALIRKAKPLSFLEGQYIMLEGDYDRVMYLITQGKVEVQIRDKSTKDKRRRREFCAATFPLAAPAYVGEFALLCKEPRSASIQCITDVDVWVVNAKDFHAVVDQLSPAIAQKQQDATDARRKENLRKYFSLRPEVIRKNKYFRNWDLGTLKELSAILEPLVLREGNTLYKEGDYEPALYFIADGKVRLTKPSEPSEPAVELGPGDVVGAFETFFLQERRSQSATCKSNCDLWKLTRQRLLDLGMSDPGALVESKKVVQEAKTADMYKLPKAPAYVLQDPYLSYVLPQTCIQLMWQLGQPRVVGAGEHLSIEGDDARCLYMVVLGAFHISHFDKELKKYDDKVVVHPAAGGVHTGSYYTNDNLKMLFPSAMFCEIPKVGGSMAKPTKSFRQAASMRFMNKQLSAIDMASSIAIAQQEGCIGVVLGAYEFAARQARWSATYRCASMCEVYVVDREAFEAQLPQALLQMHRTATSQIRVLIDAFLSHNASSLLALPSAQRISGAYLAAKAQEKQKDKTQSGGGAGGAKRVGHGLLRVVQGGS